MAATIHNDQLQTPQHPQHQHVQQQSARNRPVSTPVPINYPRYPDIIQQPPPPIPQSSVRRGNMFGPYLLLQTLGEGEFGKVKLGMHVDTGEEVAIKLIRKESVDTPSRLTKIEREIGVLRGVMHPNIVKLYDVFETDRYIGIIMEYASGGELFDHILAHRYLKERDACRLFAQLISGVNYLHQKNIVHRDLKLENLLLDRNRNIIITDFGFANQFNGAHDDLMATSCGSPCYAAPELVISEGLYVGSAVDIWSCGVILYAMLSGYLPFDDDPQNPDGDNINLLYKYIINTPLVFPDYVSPDARDLLRKMLVPDPTKRCDMKIIMSHRWLAPYASIFDYSIQELEAAANPVPSLVPPESYLPSGISASNSYLTADYMAEQPSTAPVNTVPTVKRHTIQVEYDYPDNPVGYADYPDEDFLFVDGTRLGANPLPTATSDMILPQEQEEKILHNKKNNVSGNSLDLNSNSEKLHNTTSDKSNCISTPSGTSSTTTTSTKTSANASTGLFTLFESDPNNNQREDKTRVNNVKNNLTVPSNGQLEPPHMEIQKSSSQTPKKRDAPRTRPVTVHGPPSSSQDLVSTPSQKKNSNSTNKQTNNNRSEITSPKIHTLSPISTPPSIPLPPIPGRRESLPPVLPPTISNGQKKHKRGLSSEKIFKFLGNGNVTSPVSVDTSNIKKGSDTLSPSTPQISQSAHLPVNHDMPSDTASDSTSAIDDISDSKSKRRPSKRKALSLMVDTLKGPASQSTHSVVSGSNVPVKDKRKIATGTSAGSSNAAKKVMDWFRRKSLDDLLHETGREPAKDEQTNNLNNDMSSRRSKIKSKRQKNNPSVVVTQPNSNVNSPSSRLSMMTTNSNVDSKLRVHHGAVDQLALTSRPPYEVFIVVKQTLVSMGIEIKREGDFKVRCIRRRRKVIDNGKPVGKETFRSQKNKEKDSLATLENSEGIIDLLAEKKRRKYSTGPLKTLLRRSPSVPNSPTFGPVMTVTSPNDGTPLPINNHSNSILTTPEILYGDPTVDSGEEIRFAVELCRIKNLPGLYIVDIKRMKGNLWGYKFLYHTLLDKLDLKGKGGYLTIGTSGGFIP
ncbi:12006_t:CDS:10 [Funneliformis caledonium]|uniref:non-specific serine/threonine protein kinase n=1 Tax=Funneliformis caledonium TaxID=1117310 RepID=A0A9N9GQ25_9GLOM|nr:12006_t:CDS:10 [Funneliformis caledonium]